MLLQTPGLPLEFTPYVMESKNDVFRGRLQELKETSEQAAIGRNELQESFWFLGLGFFGW